MTARFPYLPRFPRLFRLGLPSRPRRHAASRQRLRLLRTESLENRTLMAGDVTAALDASRSLNVVGSEQPEQVAIVVSDARGAVEVREGDRSVGRFALADLDRITIQMGDGGDFVNVVDPNYTLDRRSVQLKIDAGEGDDTVLLTTAAANLGDYRSLRDTGTLVEAHQQLLAQLQSISIESLAGQAVNVLQTFRSSVTDVALSGEELARQAFTAAESLLQLVDEQFSTPFQEFSARYSDLTQQLERFTETAGTTLAELPLPDDATSPTLETDVPDYEATGATLEAGADRQLAAAQALADEVQQIFTEVAAKIQAEARRTIELPADQVQVRGQTIAANAETALLGAERAFADTEAALQRKLAQLEPLVQNLVPAFDAVTRQLLQAKDVAAKVPASQNKCQVNAVHTFVGGGGADVFFPASSPLQSWSISGNAGNDILLGGFVADEIQGGIGNDLILGLKGNDLITGDRDADLLFGEFLVDIPYFTGDDCVFGGAGTDLVVGDNGLDPFNYLTPGGRDELHGDDDIDLLVGDDISDIVTPTAGGNDLMFGGSEFDVMLGNGGDDTLEGGKYIDVQFGNDGDDTLYAIDNTFTGDGYTIPSTTIVLGGLQFGNQGKDTILGGDGLDVQFGNDGMDTIHGKDYVDIQFGNADIDDMYGEDGGVVVVVSSVPVRFGNLMFGGTEDDQMWGGGDLDVMFGNDDNDQLYGYDGNFVPLGIDSDVMFGGKGDDVLLGDAEQPVLWNSNDWMFGEAGNDKLKGGSQNDVMFGGSGDDSLAGDSNGVLLVNSKDLMFGNDGDDTMGGGNSLDLMFGNAGNDTMYGDDESTWLVTSVDVMFGNDGDDTMSGGSQTDIVLGNAGNDHVNGDSNSLLLPLSNDAVFGNDGNDTLDGGNGADLVVGGNGDDTMQGDNSAVGMATSLDLMFGDDGDDRMDGGNNPDMMFGNAGDDTMMGDNGSSTMPFSSDLMLGNTGCDEMLGGRATDVMFGNEGTDTMNGQQGVDLMAGNAGTDLMSGGDLPDVMYGNDDGDIMHGNDGQDLVFGNDGNDCLYGDSHADLVSGGNGDDCVRGGNSGDLLFGRAGQDKVFGDDGRDIVFGNDQDDKLEGGDNADILFGNNGDDELWGGPGWDILWGHAGNDTLWGGSGGDSLFPGSGSNSTNQGGPDYSGLDCNCIVMPCKFDFGDAPNTYSTLLPNGARHGLQGPRLGGSIDHEPDGQPSPNADRDDTSSIDDEDGVIISSLTQGLVTPVSVTLSNAPSARLDAWVDFNANGLFDAAEQIATSVPISSGANTVNISTPLAAVLGPTMARFRVSSTGGLGPAGLSLDGEVEDYRVQVVRRERDFGDAPNSYFTTAASNGPNHDLGGPRLGTLIDAEVSGLPTASAQGDDTAASDDEDGVVLNPIIPGFPSVATVTLSGAASARLDAWVDFNGNGTFDHPAEQVFNATPLVAGANVLSYAVPSTSVFSTYARFRVTPNGIASPIGYGGVGEVEDYRIMGETNVHDFGDAPDSYQTTIGASGPYHTLGGPQLGTLIDFESDGQPSPGASGDDGANLDDEDGVVFSPMTPGSASKVTVTLSNAATAQLDAWVDFNANGIFDHPSEKVLNAVPIASGANSLAINVPATAVPGATYARFRVSPVGGLTPGGFGGLGEVEDYAATLSAAPQPVTPFVPTTSSFTAAAASYREFQQQGSGQQQTITFDGLTGEVKPDAFAASHGLRLTQTKPAFYAIEGDKASIENLDGFDGSYEKNGSTALVKPGNHASGLTLAFDPPVQAVGGFVATGKEGTVETLSVEAFDAAGKLLSKHQTKVNVFQDGANREGFWGLRANTGLISSVRITNDNTTNFGNALILDNLMLERPGIALDVNGDGTFDGTDVDAIQEAIDSGNAGPQYDINGDGTINATDVKAFVTERAHSDVGDANVDGEFTSADFVNVFQAGLYETQRKANWTQGDWDMDGTFTTTDFVTAFQAGWYEKGPQAAVIADDATELATPEEEEEAADESTLVAEDAAGPALDAAAVDWFFSSLSGPRKTVRPLA